LSKKITRHIAAHTRALSLLAALCAAATLARGQEPKQMAITLDDLPFAYGRHLTDAEQREAVTRVLAMLDRQRVTATVFVIGRSVTDANRGLVDAFARAGHVVGSHSFSHPDLGAVSAEDYILDIQKGEEAIKPWLKGVQYFRYPFLRQGNTVEKRDAVLSWMASRGIVVAPVTIDNDDYVFNQRLVDAKAAGRAIDVRDAYLDHMVEAAANYDAKARAKVGRPVRQVLLLHMNYLNSLYLDDLLQRFRNAGWSFITFEEALKDDVYRLKYDYVGVQGAGHLDAIKPAAR
jgi:peptidoglycan/xylan/chitin deacetylase (PgdA/CDA1 family)